MTNKDPFNINEMLKAFSPEATQRMFAALTPGAEDRAPEKLTQELQELAQTYQRSLDMMMRTNSTVGEAYGDLFVRQTRIFSDLAALANDQMTTMKQSGADAEKQAEAYKAVMDQAMELMRKSVEATQQANEKALKELTAGVDAVAASLKNS
ncbi:hypothetical protein [Natronohydrobacter thiooxidans]|uniref:hypothetical protein n=1 Tax=Natronohydrobacter thiooxidans TaxID=87172 RepID=UPI000A451A94|nr:hypothetical protein [Natronohydrobacter thiooxidans]